MRVIAGILRLRRKRRGRQLAPFCGAFAAPQLGAEMSEIERGMDGIALGQHGTDRFSEEMRCDDVPHAITARELEQSFAGSNMEPLCHTPSSSHRSALETHR